MSKHRNFTLKILAGCVIHASVTTIPHVYRPTIHRHYNHSIASSTKITAWCHRLIVLDHANRCFVNSSSDIQGGPQKSLLAFNQRYGASHYLSACG